MVSRPTLGFGGGPHGSPKPPRRGKPPMIRRAQRALSNGKPNRANKLMNRAVGLPAKPNRGIIGGISKQFPKGSRPTGKPMGGIQAKPFRKLARKIGGIANQRNNPAGGGKTRRLPRKSWAN